MYVCMYACMYAPYHVGKDRQTHSAVHAVASYAHTSGLNYVLVLFEHAVELYQGTYAM